MYNLLSILLIIPFSLLSFYFIKKKPILGIYLIAFSLPFERIPSWEVPILGVITVRISHILVFITLLVLFLELISKKVKISFDKLEIILAISFLAMGLSLLFAQNINRGIYVWVFLWFCYLVFWLFKNFVTKENFPVLEKILFYSTLVICTFALFQFFGDMFGLPNIYTGLKDTYTKEVMGFPRVQAFSFEPLFFANFLLLPFGLFSFLYLSNKSLISSKGLAFIIFYIVTILAMTVSRGGIIASIFILVCSLIYGIILLKRFKKTFCLLCLVLFGVLFAVLTINFSSKLVNRDTVVESFSAQATNFDKGASVSERGEWRNAAIRGFKEKPIFGIGLGNFGPWFAGYPKVTPKEGWLVVNNETFEILVETGLVGFLSFAIFIFFLIKLSVIKYFESKNDYEKILIISFLVILFGYAIQYQAFSTLYIVHIWATIGMLAALVSNNKFVFLKKG